MLEQLVDSKMAALAKVEMPVLQTAEIAGAINVIFIKEQDYVNKIFK